MRFLLKHLFIFCLLCSCNENTDTACAEMRLSPIFFDRITTNYKHIAYNHYLYLENYADNCMSKTGFFSKIESYYYLQKTKKPIRSIIILKKNEGMGFENNELDFKEISNNTLFSLLIDPASDSLLVQGVEICDSGSCMFIRWNLTNWENTK